MSGPFDDLFKDVKTNTTKVGNISPKVASSSSTANVNTSVMENGEVINIRVQDDVKIEPIELTFEQLLPRRGIKALVFGRQKSGKSELLLKAADLGVPVRIIDLENGLIPLMDNVKEKDIKIYPVVVVDEGEPGHYTIERDEYKTVELFKATLGKIKNEAIQYNKDTGKLMVIGIDSMSVFWEVVKEWLNVDVIRQGGKLNKKGIPSDRRDWGKVSKLWDGIMGMLMNLPAHVILIAQAKDAYEVDEKGYGHEAGFDDPRVRKTTPHQVDLTIQLFVDEEGGRYFAKVRESRYPKLKRNQLFENLTLQKLIDAIK